MSGFNTKQGQEKASANSLATRRDMAQAHAQQVVPHILARYREGWPLRRIADALNFSDITPPRGGRWHVSQVKRILGLLEGQGERYSLTPRRRILFLAKTFEEKQYADQFVDGRLYCNRLSEFKKRERDDANRNDPYEGISVNLQPGTLIVTINNFDISNDLCGPSTIQFDRLNHLHLFCMHAGHSGQFSNTSHQSLKELEELLKIPEDCKEFGDHTVFITDVGEFIRRVESTCRKQHYKLYRKSVDYYDPDIFHGTFDGIEAVFKKHDKYKNQREFRFAIDTGTAGSDPIDFDIGDISDISMRCSIETANRSLSLSVRD